MLNFSPAAGFRKLQPRERVIVFSDHVECGASLGYRGSVVRIHTNSVRQHPTQPALWEYSIYVRNFDKCVDLPASSLFATGQLESDDSLIKIDESLPMLEVRIHHKISKDNAAIHGAYRVPRQEWSLFTFRKCGVAPSSYDLSLPMPGDLTQIGELIYSVPATECLDKDYILRAIAELSGIGKLNQ